MFPKAIIQKVFQTALLMFIILILATIPIINNNKVLRTNLELEDITSIPTDQVYLKNKDDYLVRVDIFLNSKKKIDKIPEIISYLKVNNPSLPIGLDGYIPKDTKLLDYQLKDDTIILDFSTELLTSSKKNNRDIITGIVYSLLELDSINNVEITIEGNQIDQFPKKMNHSIGINQKYNITSRNDIQEVTIYYLDRFNSYYLPITKYVNDKKDKIEIIIEELKNPTEKNVISPLNNQLKLLNYREEQNVLFLNFNHELDENNSLEKEKVMNTIAYSSFANYDVNMVMLEIKSQASEFRKRGES